MLMDKKFRLFGKISIADIFMCAALVLFILFALSFSGKNEVAAAEGDSKIRFTVEFHRRDVGFSDNIVIGETVFDTERSSELGVVVDKYEDVYKVDAPDDEGNVYRRAAVDGYVFAYVVIEANASIMDGKTLVGNYEVMVGKEAFVRAKSFAGGGYIIKIEK